MSSLKSTQNQTSTSHPAKDIRPLSRFITTHNADGKAILADTVSPQAPVQDILGGALQFPSMYTNARHPQMSNDKDINEYSEHLITPPGITIPNSTVCQVCDYPPGYLTPMHRTVSLDYGVVLEGEIELVLDRGETKLLTRGDVVVQCGTNHAWRNVTPDAEVDGRTVQKWARMFNVLQAAEAIILEGGRILEEDQAIIDKAKR